MKILLIGDKGQVGREIAALALEKSHEVAGYDVGSLDVTDAVQVADVVNKHKDSSVLINAAAYTAVDKAEDESGLAFAVNCDGVKNLALACCKYDIPILHISTDYVFSGEAVSAYSEEDLPDPVGVYGASKLAGEKILQDVWEKSFILRVSWVFGRYGNNFVKTILRLARERHELNVVGDQFGCPTPAADIARVLIEVGEKIELRSKYGVYHYVGSSATTWFDFAERCVELGKKRFDLQLQYLNKITTAQYPTKAKRPQNSELQVEKIMGDYGVERHDWLEYLEKVISEVEL